MRSLKYVVYREEKYFVAQCLNVDVSSFGKSLDEAVTNLKDAVELYLKDDSFMNVFHDVGDALIGELQRRFWEIFPTDAVDAYQGHPLHGEIRARYGAHLLRNNRWWLD